MDAEASFPMEPTAVEDEQEGGGGGEGEEEWDGTEEMRKKVLNKYMDEIYGMDFNDVVSLRPSFSPLTHTEGYPNSR